MSPLTQSAAWRALSEHQREIADARIAGWFAEDAERFAKLSFRCGDLLVDFSRQHLAAQTLPLLLELARAADLAAHRRAMRRGEAINFTEGRAALHIALRSSGDSLASALRSSGDSSTSALRSGGDSPNPAGREIEAEVLATRARMRELSETLRQGAWRGGSGAPIEAVVNLGIGGSDLGPRMAVQALADEAPAPLTVRFVANIDPAEFRQAVRDLDPARTLFIISSKTFATQETLSNAEAARAWLGGLDANRHFLAVSNNRAAAQAFGVAPENCLGLPEWVGGRYSLWSAIGLPLACAIGMDGFEALLEGAREMDAHFFEAPDAANLPVLMALIGLWNIDFLGMPTLAVLPYAHRLRRLPSYLQQLEMESNGKRVDRTGAVLDCATAPIVWGMAGSVGQHAFHQLLYQGSHRVPIDFIVPLGPAEPARQALVANALAQAAALTHGRDLDAARQQLLDAGQPAEAAGRLAAHRVCPGNQPSTTLLLRELNPRALGQLIALYEHKVAVQGWLWGINSFDQWGVELGKQMAREISSGPAVRGERIDGSTRGLLAAIANLRGESR